METILNFQTTTDDEANYDNSWRQAITRAQMTL
jgi:hypothetical protein